MTIDTGRAARTRAVLAADGPYEIRHGDVWLRGQTVHVTDGSGRLAVAFDEEGVIVARGEASRVAAKVRDFDARMGVMGDDAPVVTVVDFPVTPATVEELNACVATTGRVLRIAEHLTEIGEEHGPLPPQVPR